MATLVSPGVSLSVSDESFYAPAGAGTIQGNAVLSWPVCGPGTGSGGRRNRSHLVE